MITYNKIQTLSKTNLDKPQVGSVWRHKSGMLYTVEGFANEHTECHDEYPIMIRYRDEQGRVWTRTLERWWSSMTFVRVADAEVQTSITQVRTPSGEQWQTLIGWLDRRRGYPTVQISGEVAGDIADRLFRELGVVAEPLFWVRLLEDGLYEGPIHNSQMDDEKRRSGQWTPLVMGQIQ